MSKPTSEPSQALLLYLGLDGENPERAGKAARKWLSQKKYRFGFTPSDFENLLGLQRGECAICKTPGACAIGKKGHKGGFHIDHDDVTRYIRGLLCDKCNRGLGYFRHSPTHLQAAIRYLFEPPAALMQPRPSIVLEQRGSRLYDTHGVRRTRRNTPLTPLEPVH